VPTDLYLKVLAVLPIFGINSVSGFFVYAARRLLEEQGLLPLPVTKAPAKPPAGVRAEQGRPTRGNEPQPVGGKAAEAVAGVVDG